MCTTQELASAVDGDSDLQEEAGIMHHVLTQLLRYQVDLKIWFDIFIKDELLLPTLFVVIPTTVVSSIHLIRMISALPRVK